MNNMKVAICSKANKGKIEKLLLKTGFEIVKKNPDFVLLYGGDGTLLYSERVYPTIPKLMIRHNSHISRKYDYSEKMIKKALEKIRDGNYVIVEEMKLDAYYKGRNITALNEVQVHTALAIRAVRFSVFIERKKFENLIGDGIIISTPFGSTGYYLATGGIQFKEGIGISFNNIYSKKIPPLVLPEDSKIKIKMHRDSALLLSDNNPKYFKLNDGDEILIQKSEEKARFILIGK